MMFPTSSLPATIPVQTFLNFLGSRQGEVHGCAVTQTSQFLPNNLLVTTLLRYPKTLFPYLKKVSNSAWIWYKLSEVMQAKPFAQCLAHGICSMVPITIQISSILWK